MFERYTERARQVAIDAEDVARGLDHDYVGPEHLLVALAYEPELVLSAYVLTSLGVTAPSLREQILRRVGRGDASSPRRIPFKPKTKEIFGLAIAEAARYPQNHVGTEQLLLALVHAATGTVLEILDDVDVDAGRVRAALIALSTVGRDFPSEIPRQPTRLRSPGAAIGGAVVAAASFALTPDAELVRALMSAATRALDDGRTQFGVDDLIAAMSAKPEDSVRHAIDPDANHAISASEELRHLLRSAAVQALRDDRDQFGEHDVLSLFAAR